MNTTQVAVDLAKSVFEVAVSRRPGKVCESHRLSRGRFQKFFAVREPVEVLMEACGTAHHWGRTLEAMGHRVRLLPPSAARNEKIDQVPVKSLDQQAIAALHRIRSGYQQTRTVRINAVRGHLREFGIMIPLGASRVLPLARAALQTDTVPAYLRDVLEEVLHEIETLSEKAQAVQRRLEQLSKQMPDAQTLMTIPGIGVLTATALVSFVGDVRRFRSGRQLAAYLGLTPREFSSGNKRRLGRITKRGNSYVRMLLIHGARSALRAGKVSDHPDDLRAWALDVERRRGHNVAAVALANKLARVAWRLWRDQRPFESPRHRVGRIEPRPTRSRHDAA